MHRSNMLFARTYPLDEQLVPTIVPTLKQFQWDRIALITHKEQASFQTTNSERITEQLKQQGIEVAFRDFVPESFNFDLDPNHRPLLRSMMIKIKAKARSKLHLDQFLSFLLVANSYCSLEYCSLLISCCFWFL